MEEVGAADLERLTDQVIGRAAGTNRFVVAVAGPPGSGKSTLAEMLGKALVAAGETCAVVPMDGFHLDNAILRSRGHLARKGAPFTFDTAGYRALMERIRLNSEQEIAVPVFDRTLDLARAGGSILDPAHRIVVTEGNYLLLDEEPWRSLASLFDMTVFLTAEREVLRGRLVQRWLDNGHDAQAAQKRAGENDLPNADLVLEHSRPADLVLHT